jgi:hypothetical protein
MLRPVFSRPLQEKLLNQELFEEFCEAFTREINRLRMEQRASMTSAKREVARIGTRIKKLLNLMLDDEIAVDEGKVEMKALDGRRKELEAQLKTADEPPALLHAEMARIYRTKVTELAEALQQPERRLEATEALRGLVDAIVLTPNRSKEELGIELRGNLAAMLGATVQTKRSPESDDLSWQVSLVAGRDLNPRPLGYEPLIAKPRGTAQGSKARIHWMNRGREATPDHPKPRQIVPDLSPRNRVVHFSTFAPLGWPALAHLQAVRRG